MRGHSGQRTSSAEAWTQTPVYSYLKVYGLQQYGRAFVEAGFAELEPVSRLSETEALEFLERLRVYPGHRLRLLRAVDCLRNAAIGAERRDAAQMLEDDAALDRLCAQNEELSKEKYETESENVRLQEEKGSLINVMRAQGSQLQKARDRIAELEDLVRAQTEQVSFLAQQLQIIAEENPSRENDLYRSYRDSFVDDWAAAEKIDLPEGKEDLGALLKQRSFTPADFGASPLPFRCGSAADDSTAASSPPAAAAEVEITPPRGKVPPPPAPNFSPPPRARLAMSLDSANVKECLAKFDVDHIIRCLASALQNKIILSLARPRPHSASPERIQACAIFLEPACKERLLMTSVPNDGSLGKTNGDPLNAVAVRTAPGTWDIYGFLRDVMVNFRLEQEVSVITLFYLDRFSSMSGVALTPDNWQRLTIAAMMLASKVWNDESFENYEFAQLCPLYALEEINTFERIFLGCVGYNMAVKTSDYAKTYFLLRTLGAKDAPEFGLAPMDPQRASRLQERCLEKQIEFRERYPEEDSLKPLAWTM